MPNIRITVENGAGVLQGQPITTAQGWRSVARVDRAGDTSFTMPAADPRGAVLAHRRVMRAYSQIDGARTEIGAGIIDSITEGPSIDGGATLQVKGPDLLEELTARSVHGLDLSSGGGAIPITTALTSIIALAPTWTIDATTYGSVGTTTSGSTSITAVTHISNFDVGDGIAGAGIPVGTTITAISGTTITLSVAATASASGVALSHPVFLQFGGESVLAALTKVAGLFGEHFRRNGRQVVYLYRQRPSSGIRAVARGEPTALAAAPDLCVITSIQRVRDASDLVTRVYPFGGGNSTARVSLLATTRYGAPGTGVTGDYTIGDYTLHIEAGHPELCHIRNDAAETIYGQIDAPPQSWKDIADPETNAASAVSAANMLFDQALAYLRPHSATQESYKLDVAGLSQIIEPGTTIDAVYRQIVDGYHAIDINTIRDATPLYVLEVSSTTTVEGVQTVGLTVAKIDRWPETMAQTVAQIATRQISQDTHLQKAALAVYAATAGTHVNADKGARVYRTTALAVGNAIWATIGFDAERWDTDGMHDTTTNTSQVVVQTAGWYVITGHISFAANATGARGIRVRLNGATVIAQDKRGNAGASETTDLSIPTKWKCAVGDVLQLQCYQTSGAALNLLSTGDYSAEFAVCLVA